MGILASFRHWLDASPPMKTSARFAACLAGCMAGALASSAGAQPGEPSALIDQQHCVFCHTSDAPFLAPSFQQIAQRYRNVPDAAPMLEQKLRTGGRAHWGDISMPLPAERGGPLSPEDAHVLVQWVLSQ